MRIILVIFLFFLSSCIDESSNPLLSGHQAYVENLNMGGPTRGIEIVYNAIASDFTYFPINHSCIEGYDIDGDQVFDGITGPEDCNGFWCEWDEEYSTCSYKSKDLLILSNEGDGLYIYEIIEEPSFSLERVYFEDNIESLEDDFDEPDLELRSVHYSENHNTIYMLDKFEKIYYLYLPHALSHQQENICTSLHDDEFQSISCSDVLKNATQFSINENSYNILDENILFEMFVLYKHNEQTNSELDVGSEIRLAYYEENPNDYICQYGYLNYTSKSPFESPILFSYDVSDIYFNNDKLFITNPQFNTCENSTLDNQFDCEEDTSCGNGNDQCEWYDYYSVDMYIYNPDDRLLGLGDSQIVDSKINTVYSFGNYMITGMKDKGCYITLLDEHGISDENNHKLHIGDSFSVYDINYDEENDMLVLSAGSNGVLLYSWDGISLDTSLIAHISSSYAYTAKMYNANKIIIGTVNGVEVFNLGE